mmetsp:Transcript_10029/g.28045  ORF Transcript_10029/g.28045 Transcript_10029/m.28045 type:complete len:223 (-) Transcript_10029:556-1224(-)
MDTEEGAQQGRAVAPRLGAAGCRGPGCRAPDLRGYGLPSDVTVPTDLHRLQRPGPGARGTARGAHPDQALSERPPCAGRRHANPACRVRAGATPAPGGGVLCGGAAGGERGHGPGILPRSRGRALAGAAGAAARERVVESIGWGGAALSAGASGNRARDAAALHIFAGNGAASTRGLRAGAGHHPPGPPRGVLHPLRGEGRIRHGAGAPQRHPLRASTGAGA